MSEDLPRLRSLLGASTALWAGPDGVRVQPGWWLAQSGARSVDYNVALCHSASDGATIAESVEAINARRVPGIIMVAGTGLGDVQHLVNAGWVCIGSVPFMSRLLDGHGRAPETSARRLVAGESDVARMIVDDVFGVGPELAAVALPDSALTAPGQSIWGLYDAGELVSCLGAVVVEDAIVVWSMATPAAHRRRGFGSRLLTAVLIDAAAAGVSRSLLHASPDGELLYRSLGYVELERWQLWSRPRWVLGRA